MTEQDEWRSAYQQLPLNIYDRWMHQLRRIALVNGVAPELFDRDNKFDAFIGPRVATFEMLVVLLERSEDEALRV